MTDDDKARVHVADTLAAECARYTTLLVTDHEALLQRAAEMGGAVHVVHWADAAQSPANDDWLMLSLAEAGKKCLIWCTPTDDGRRIAREAGRTLKPGGRRRDAHHCRRAGPVATAGASVRGPGVQRPHHLAAGA